MAKAQFSLQSGLRLALAKYNGLSKKIDSAVGISEVDTAQNSVKLAENIFLEKRNDVQKLQIELEAARERLRDVRTKLDRCSREDEHYLGLVTDEHNLVKEERVIRTKLDVEEEVERDQFALFSTAVRSSHEKERARTERTKYWSLIFSALGTITGFALSSILTHYRFKKIENLTPNSMLIESTNEAIQRLEGQSKILETFTNNIGNTQLKNEAKDQPTADIKGIIEMMKQLEINQKINMKEITDQMTMRNITLSDTTSLRVSDYENWSPEEHLKFDNMPLEIYNTLLSRISLGLSLFSQGLLLYIVITGR